MVALAWTSTPWVGSSSSSTRGLRRSHLAITTFCWLPPESVPKTASGRRGRTSSRSIQSPTSARSPERSSSRSGVSLALQVGQRAVLAHAQPDDRALAAPVGRHEAIPAAIAPRGSGHGLLAVDAHLAARGRDPEQQRQDLLATRPGKSGDPEDLPAPAVDVDVVDLQAAQPADLERDLIAAAVGAVMRRAKLLAADHQRHEPILVEFADVPGAHPPAVAQDGDAIPDREDLVEAVGHVDDAEARRGRDRAPRTGS